MKLKKEQRATLIEKLSLDFVDSYSGDDRLLFDIAEDGFKGFKNLSNKLLLQLHIDAFDYEFISTEDE